MIEINLLPGSGKKKKAAGRQGLDVAALMGKLNAATRDRFMIGCVAACVIAVAAAGYLYWSQDRRDTDLQGRLTKAVKDSSHYATLLKDRYSAEAKRDTLLRQVNLIRSIDEDRYVWPHIMDEVSRALPQYTWLTIFAFGGTPQGANNVVALPKPAAADTAKRKKAAPKRLDTSVPKDPITVRITGRTVDIEALTRFMRDLSNSPFLSAVNLERSVLATEQAKDVTEFALTMSYRRPDSTAVHRVPFTLTGVGSASGGAGGSAGAGSGGGR